MFQRKQKKVSLVLVLAVFFCMSTFSWTSAAAAENQTTAAEYQNVNKDASYEAKALLNYLYDISGKGIISGQFNYIESPDMWTNRSIEITGKQPGLWGADFSFYFGVDLPTARQELVNTAIEQWKNGSIVALCFHEQKPNDPWDEGWGSVQGHYSDIEMNELVTPGTTLYNQWLADIDKIAEYLKQLRDAGVPVLWRPYHEMNGGWFWWGGRGPQFIQLWKNMYDRFTNYHQLNNLIWEWGPNANNDWADPLVDYYPGDDYVDFCAVDIYDGFKAAYYDETLEVAGGKPIAIGECGTLPNLDELKANQPQYCFFMAWGNLLEAQNSTAQIQEVYNHPYVLNADRMNIQLPANLLKNPEFDYGMADWSWQLKGGEQGNTNIVTDGGLSGINSLRIQLTNEKAETGKAELSQAFPIENGKCYNISFQAKSAADKTIRVNLVDKDGKAYFSQIVNVTPISRTFGPYTFLSDRDDNNTSLQFDVGGDMTPLWLDKIKITNSSLATPVPALIPLTEGNWITIGDRNKDIKFSGSWVREEANRDYNDGHIYSNSVNSSAELSFIGTSVEYYGSSQGDLGIADIYIDGVKDASVDLYKPGNGSPRTLLYKKENLIAGKHTIKVVVTGEKNQSSSDTKVELDSFKYLYEQPTPTPTPTPTPPPSPTPTPILTNLVRNPEFDSGTSDWYWQQGGDASGNITVVTAAGLSGDNALKATMENGGVDPWNAQINQNLPVQSGKTYTISFMAKADAPRSISAMLQQNQQPYGSLWYQEISLTTTAQTFGPYTFTCSGDDPTAVLRFNVGGDSTGVTIDNVICSDGTIYVPPLPTIPDNTWGVVDDQDPWVTYVGQWFKDHWAPDYNGTESYSRTAGNSVEFSFNGTGIQYISYKQNNLGFVDIYLDGVLESTLDLFNQGGTGPVQSVLFEKTGMVSGTHTIKLVVTGSHNEASTDPYVVLDAFKYINEVP